MTDFEILLRRSNISDKTLVKRHIDELLSEFSHFRVELSSHVFEDGSEKPLLSLTGTISYNTVPIQLYLNDSYPLQVPIVYVRPRPETRLKTSYIVNSNGQINLSSLIEWEATMYDLYILVNLLTFKFNDDNPLLEPDLIAAYSDSSLPSELMQQSLMTAVQEKLKHRFFDLFEQELSKAECLKKIESDLKANQTLIVNSLNRHEAIIDELDGINRELKAASQRLDSRLKRLVSSTANMTMGMEDVIIPTCFLHRQILELHAQELAIQDFIFYLNQGLYSGTLSLDIYLKQVRASSRKLFFVRATILKAREQANLN
jgi:hypothetical protein